MRIIAGEHRGRRLLGPEDDATTRPITDRVKTSLFDRLDATGRIEGAIVADLFAGTGSLGLECLSRGASHVTFIERDRGAADRLRRNLEALRIGAEAAALLRHDALGAALIDDLTDRPPTLIFVDPPYRMMLERGEARRVVRQMERLATVAGETALLILRTERHAEAPRVAGWADAETHHYGSMDVHHYERASAGGVAGATGGGAG